MRPYLRVLAISMGAWLLAAPLAGQDSANVTLTVDATMDLYRAGGYSDGSDGIGPAVYTFRAGRGKTLTFSSVSGAWTCSPSVPQYGPEGTSSGCFQPGGQNISDPGGPFSSYHLTDFEGAVAAVFLADNLPTAQSPGLRFYEVNASLGGVQTNFMTLSPEIGQIFFIGDGLTGSGNGSIQVFVVPPTATHLYLGYVDSCDGGPTPGCYSDNSGSMTANLTLHQYLPNWVQPKVTSTPGARSDVSLAYDGATGSTLLFGGDNARIPGVVYGDTWMWQDGWTQLSPAASPPARACAGMAYDPTDHAVLLFGGQDGNGVVMGDTWAWDGTTWRQQFPAVSPPARCLGQAMVYNPVTRTIMLFGGFGNENGDYGAPPFGDTWEWNGNSKTWIQKFPLSSPSARGASLSFDVATKTVVLFGGNNGGGDCCRIIYGDTWTWDGVNWTQQAPASSPSARSGASMAYDPSLGEVVVFGGTSGPPQGFNDTWAWDGKIWTKLDWAYQPTGLFGGSVDFDWASRGLLLFGGELAGDVVSDNTWLFVPVPVR